MRILVTGGAGFSGSHLAENWVQDGHEVTVMNTRSALAEHNIAPFSSNLSIVWGSVTDRELVDETVRSQDVVVHMAAHINVDESVATPRQYLEVNLGGTLNVLEAIRQSEVRLIYASSREVYGHANHSPVPEHAELRPLSPYAVSKAGADRMCFAYHKSYGLDITVVRSCNIYGERQKAGQGGAVIPIFASLAASGKPLSVFGTGSQQREYMHVKDLVSAYDLVLQHNDLSGAVLNLGTGETPSVKEIAEFISDKMGVSIIHEQPRPGEISGFTLDSSRIMELGFTPQVKFWDGLLRYLEAAEHFSAVST